jgi:hypothetical protein
MRLVSVFRWLGFDPNSDNVRFVDKVSLGQVFCQYYGFPCQFSFHWMLHIHLSSWARKIRPLEAGVPSGIVLNPPPRNKTKIRFSDLLRFRDISEIMNYVETTFRKKYWRCCWLITGQLLMFLLRIFYSLTHVCMSFSSAFILDYIKDDPRWMLSRLT